MFQKIFSAPRPRERPRESLPKAPGGMAWWQEPETREWKLVPEDDLAALEGTQREVTVDFVQATSTADSRDKAAEKTKKETKDVFSNPFDLPNTTEEDNTLSLPEELAATNIISNVHHDNLTANNQAMLQLEKEMVKVVLQNLPPSSSEDSKSDEADWELLSDRLNNSLSNHSSSHNTNSNGFNMVHKNGSVSSHSFTASYNTKMHQRTPSNSTLDSYDYNHLGPSGKGILGVDYVEHVILPDDTLQGICLAYKVHAHRLKRANHFTGESLNMAPKKLVIPISKAALKQGYLRVQDTDSKEYKLQALQAEFPENLGRIEAKAYLELADWILADAIASAREDYEWESSKISSDQLKSGQIRVMMNVKGGSKNSKTLNFSAQGAGYSPPRKPIDPKLVQAKSLQVQDMHAVSPQHNSVGVEMQSFYPQMSGKSSPQY